MGRRQILSKVRGWAATFHELVKKNEKLLEIENILKGDQGKDSSEGASEKGNLDHCAVEKMIKRY